MRRTPSAGHVEAAPLDFSDPDGLVRSMQGAGVLYNTYWIRYARGLTTFDLAVDNTGRLFEAAKRAGVGRIVHFSVTNASLESGLPYFRAKAQVEDMLKDLGVSYAIIRPTLVFGVGDLLLNNMAWALRRFPVFPVYGSGDYPVQPVYVEDLAAQAVEAGSQERELRRRRGRAGHVLLRGAASPVGFLDGRPCQAGAHSPVGGARPDRTGGPPDAGRRADPR